MFNRKKIVTCPQCGKRSRVPIRPNKTLEVSCPGCRGSFHVQFKNPLFDFFTWYKGKGVAYNLKSYYFRWKLLPLMTRFKVFLVVMILFYSLMGTMIMTYGDKNNQKKLEKMQQAKEKSPGKMKSKYAEEI